MLPKKFDTTLALKAIALTNRLNGTGKRIAAALLDHFNRQTGRCDPSYETMAKLLSIHKRTVGRGVATLVKIKFFRMITHGGNNHCNSYQPNWELFRAQEESWKRGRREHADRFAILEMSSSAGQSCPSGGGQSALQTYSNNLIQLTCSATEQVMASAEGQRPVGDLPANLVSSLGVFAARIERRLGKAVYHAWFRDVHFVEATKEKIILSALTRLAKSRIEQRFESEVLECFCPEYAHAVRVEVVLRIPPNQGRD
jgi:hypothetical protein